MDFLDSKKKPSEKKAKSVHETWKQATEIMIGAGISVAFFFISSEKLIAFVTKEPIVGVLAVLLLILTVVSFGLYIFSMFNEMGIIFEYLSPSLAPRPGPSEFLRIIGIGVFYGALISVVTLPLFYCSLMILLIIFDIYFNQYLVRHVYMIIKQDVIENTIKTTSLSILYDFYIIRPFFTRGTVLLCSYFIALILVIVNQYDPDEYLIWIAYILLIINIIYGELTIYKWRKKRDNKLEQLQVQPIDKPEKGLKDK